MVKKYKYWQHKSNISLYVMKPTITTCNLFYLKVIIFLRYYWSKKKCLTLKSQKVVIFWDGGSIFFILSSKDWMQLSTYHVLVLCDKHLQISMLNFLSWSVLLPSFQNIGRFGFSRFIVFAMHLDITYI